MLRTPEEEKLYEKATKCGFCEKTFEFSNGGASVFDHCHLTGRYRCAAHKMCNLEVKQSKKINIFFHNLAGFDSHLLLSGFKSTEVEGEKTKEWKIIPCSSEKVKGLSWGPYDFKDSILFLQR